MKLIYFTIFLLAACGHGRNEKQDNKSPLDQVVEVHELYKELYKGVADESGIYHNSDCDTLLFNALSCAGGVDLILEDFELERTGKLYRTPAKTCFAEGRSGSEISRDHIVGAMWCLDKRGDVDALRRIRDYGDDHKWVMGEGSLDRTFLTPNIQDTLYRLIGLDWKGVGYAWVDPIKDHQRHIVALNIILRGEKDGWINDEMLGLLIKFRDENPENALFTYGVGRFTDGNQDDTINILLTEAWFPRDRLPNTDDRCGRWLWERSDDHEGRKPCSATGVDQIPIIIHSGGDFIFIAELLRQSNGRSLTQ
jgi:hypothetical protein